MFLVVSALENVTASAVVILSFIRSASSHDFPDPGEASSNLA